MTDANEMLDQLCSRPLIEKVRHIVWHEGLRWEVDEFLNENAPLVVAEIELTMRRKPSRCLFGQARKLRMTGATPIPIWRASRFRRGKPCSSSPSPRGRR